MKNTLYCRKGSAPTVDTNTETGTNVDVSSLQEGSYLLNITLENAITFEGDFELGTTN